MPRRRPSSRWSAACPGFDGWSSFSTWVYRIATNAALDELSRKRRPGGRSTTNVRTATSPSACGPSMARRSATASTSTWCSPRSRSSSMAPDRGSRTSPAPRLRRDRGGGQPGSPPVPSWSRISRGRACARVRPRSHPKGPCTSPDCPRPRPRPDDPTELHDLASRIPRRRGDARSVRLQADLSCWPGSGAARGWPQRWAGPSLPSTTPRLRRSADGRVLAGRGKACLMAVPACPSRRLHPRLPRVLLAAVIVVIAVGAADRLAAVAVMPTAPSSADPPPPARRRQARRRRTSCTRRRPGASRTMASPISSFATRWTRPADSTWSTSPPWRAPTSTASSTTATPTGATEDRRSAEVARARSDGPGPGRPRRSPRRRPSGSPVRPSSFGSHPVTGDEGEPVTELSVVDAVDGAVPFAIRR